jgi:hypothetical protein
MDSMPQLDEPAFDNDWVTCLPEAAQIILGHAAGGPAGQTMDDTPASVPETPAHNSGDDLSDEKFQAGWGPMPGDREPDD